MQLSALLPEAIPVITSPLRRAQKLALKLHAEPCIDARLSEINFGSWEGQPWDTIDRAVLDQWAADILNFAPPGGESVAMLQARATEFAESLAIPCVALVTHAGIMRALYGYWHKLPVAEWTQLKFDFGCITKICV